MFHPTVIAASLDRYYQDPSLAPLLDQLALPLHEDYPVVVCHQMKEELDGLVHEDGTVDAPSWEQQQFILHEVLRSKVDYAYCAQRYHVISAEAAGIKPLYPLWESQAITLDRLAQRELQCHREGWGAVMALLLKARQLGLSTLTQSILTHKVTTQGHLRALVASDIEDASKSLYGMFEIMLEHLPYWLKPPTRNKAVGERRVFDTGTVYWAAWGKSSRGGLKERGGQKGNLGRGKSQPLSEPVLTPLGWKLMGEIRPGDFVVGRNGMPTLVTDVYPQGEQPTYAITFSDGRVVRASADHLWSVERWEREDRPLLAEVRKTTELLDLKARKGVWRYRVPMTAPVAYLPTQALPLDPYVVGVLLGDGGLSTNTASITTADADIFRRVESRLPSGYCLGPVRDRTRTPTRSIIAVKKGPRNRVLTILRRLGMLGKQANNKAIPTVYALASVSERVALLQGLLDTDGWIDKDDRVGFSTVSPELAEGVRHLVESLGGTAKPAKKQPYYTYRGVRKAGQQAIALTIRLPLGIEPFWLERKALRYDERSATRRSPSRAIVAIDYIGYTPSQCIRVAADDHLYLTTGHVVTHNTISQFHLSELSTWEYPEQLDDGFFPAVPLKISTFGILESTAKGRGGYWHDKWRSTLREGSDFVGVFIPWYAEVSKYSRPAPASWSPRDETLAHARACEASSHRYLGRTAHLTREQLYWWEKKREEFEAQGRLYQFLEEWPATDEEAFQFSTASCFPIHLTERIANSAKAPLVVCELRPQTPAARLVDDERQRLLAAEEGRPFTPSATLDAPDPTARAGRPVVPILLPDGYGFRALTQADLRDRVASWGQRGLLDLLQVWEAPRRKGPRRYILAADVAEGVGKDRSVCDVIRCPTVMEPAEQVAQFITDSRDPASFAYVMDALGRWYTDEDGVEAMACPETNVGPGGVTLNTLQLHLGYGNLYIWEYIDAADPSRRLSRKAGWWTNTRTRPALLGKLYGALTTVDPITHQPDFIVHSPWTLTDLRDFQSPTGRLEDGEARSGAFDDCVMAAGIGIYVAWQKAGGERTPIEELRRARSAEQALLQTKADQQSRDWRNTPCPAEYASLYLRPEEDPGDPDVTTRFEGDRLPAADSLFDNSQWFRYSR